MDDVFDDWPEPDFDATEPEARHDPKVDDAAVKLLGFIEGNPGEVFYEVGRIRFYFHIKNRYWKRKAAEIRKLVEQFSEPALPVPSAIRVNC